MKSSHVCWKVKIITTNIAGFDTREDRRFEAVSSYPIQIVDDFDSLISVRKDSLVICKS